MLALRKWEGGKGSGESVQFVVSEDDYIGSVVLLKGDTLNF